MIETTIREEVGEAGPSHTIRFAKNKGYTGNSVNLGRKFYRNVKVQVCPECNRSMGVAASTFGGFKLAFGWWLISLGGIWFFDLSVENNITAAIIAFWIPFFLLIFGSIRVILNPNPHLNKTPSIAVLVCLAIFGILYGRSKLILHEKNFFWPGVTQSFTSNEVYKDLGQLTDEVNKKDDDLIDKWKREGVPVDEDQLSDHYFQSRRIIREKERKAINDRAAERAAEQKRIQYEQQMESNRANRIESERLAEVRERDAEVRERNRIEHIQRIGGRWVPNKSDIRIDTSGDPE